MAHVLYAIFVLAAFCIAGSLQSSPYLQCDEGPVPLDLRIDGCDKFPCPFYKGRNVSAEWDFRVVDDTETLTPRIRATVFGVVVDYPFPQKDACKSLTNGECPLDQDEEVTYALQMPVSKIYPRIPLTVEFALIGDDNVVHVCFKVEAAVKNPLNLL